MKYDFIIAVLSSPRQEKFLKRIKNFIEIYGLKFTNHNNISFKLLFLADGPEPDFIKSLCSNYDYEWSDCGNDAPTSLRFVNYIYKNPINYKWIFQVDDDSSTDIDRTYELLSDFYDYNDPICLISGRTGDMCIKQQMILRDMKMRNIFFGRSDLNGHQGPPMFVHSWEATLYSMSAVQKIKLCNRTEQYLKLTHKYKVSWTDNGASVLAKICKVPIVESTFFDSSNDIYEDYSAINPKGRLTHIHYIIDSWENYKDFLTKMQENKDKVFKTDFGDIDNKTIHLWEFYSINTSTLERKFHGNMQLNKDGTIDIYNNTNERYWERSKEDIITLFDENRKPTSLLYPQNNQVYLGDFLLDRDNKIKHELKKIE
jgi:hypothetical protein|tara:strand:+ start:7629 stop:8741 length:1113 start_codon:yes stop_codon:yes gene_type:complete